MKNSTREHERIVHSKDRGGTGGGLEETRPQGQNEAHRAHEVLEIDKTQPEV